MGRVKGNKRAAQSQRYHADVKKRENERKRENEKGKKTKERMEGTSAREN